jgi:hypothetical protein
LLRVLFSLGLGMGIIVSEGTRYIVTMLTSTIMMDTIIIIRLLIIWLIRYTWRKVFNVMIRIIIKRNDSK